jgi:hypothetical protein
MTSIQKCALALSILVLPSAFPSVHAQVAETKAGTATVSGRVNLKGEPARGVMVTLQAQNQGASNAPRARTDESGRFHFTGVSAGRYSVSALAPGYVSPEDTNFGMRGKTLNITEGEKVENVNLEIKRGGVISGKIADLQGRPVIEERVNLSKLDSNNQLRGIFYYSQNFDMYQTDDRGLYRIYGLPEGRYLVSVGYAESPGSASITSRREFYPRVFYPNATSESEAKIIEVTEGSEAANIDITVPDPKLTHDVDGRVVDAGTGQPVAGVEVVIGGVTREGRYAGGYAGSGVRSGPNGELRMFGVLPGKYALLVPPEESGGFVGDPVIFDISEGDAHGVELRVRKGASISGMAVIEGTNDPNVLSKLSQVHLLASIRPTGSNAPPMAVGRRPFKVNADGSFRIEGIQSGKAIIIATPPPDMRGLMVGRIEHNGAPAPEGIEVNPGEQVTGVRLVLVYGALTLRGEVKIVGGAFSAGQKFRAIARRVDQPMQNLPGGDVDARGQFVIENLAPGEYEIRVLPSFNQNNERLDPQIMRLFASVKERVYVGGGNQQTVTIVIDLSRVERDR